MSSVGDFVNDSDEENSWTGTETHSDVEDDDYHDLEYDDDIDHCLEVEPNYTVLSVSDIHLSLEDTITHLSTVLSITKDSAIILLCYYAWNVSAVHDEWFADENKVRNAVGLLEKTVIEYPRKENLVCPICLEAYLGDSLKSATCGHLFCTDCWTGYIATAINDGPRCVTLHCPYPSCVAAITEEIIYSFASREEKEKYSRYFLRSFVEVNKKIKWCPAPDCDYAVEFHASSGSYDVSCKCSCSFCWNCTEEAHRPVDCGTVAKWLIKNSSESENMNWILANSKPCPKCMKPIEKRSGCMHMTCSPPCKFDFCWLCLGPWTEHNGRTGGFYACNTYNTTRLEGTYDEAEIRKERAKNSLERYTHYYERWATNQKSAEIALADLQKMQTMKKLVNTQHEPEAQLHFIIEAWEQIIECRRVLKWTYASGYYLPEDQCEKKLFFEYVQGEAESALERLHHCAEKELDIYLLAEGPHDNFGNFKSKLAGLTSVTGTYFKNLVRALENGLSDVDSRTSCSRTTEGGGRRSYWKSSPPGLLSLIYKCEASSMEVCSRGTHNRKRRI